MIVIHAYPTAAANDTAWITIINEAFAEHWGGYIPWTPHRWQGRLETDLGAGPRLLALRDNEPAGVLLSRILELEDGGGAAHRLHRGHCGPSSASTHRNRGYPVRSALICFASAGVKRAVLLFDRTSESRSATVYQRCRPSRTKSGRVRQTSAGDSLLMQPAEGCKETVSAAGTSPSRTRTSPRADQRQRPPWRESPPAHSIVRTRARTRCSRCGRRARSPDAGARFLSVLPCRAEARLSAGRSPASRIATVKDPVTEPPLILARLPRFNRTLSIRHRRCICGAGQAWCGRLSSA